MTEDPIRVLVVDDHPLWVEAVRSDLAKDPGIKVVAEARSGLQAIEEARRAAPDVVLMDLDMPDVDGIQATREIIRESPQVGVLIVSALDDERDVLEALRAGAKGYVLKTADQNFSDAVRGVRRGDLVFTPAVADILLREVRTGGAHIQPGDTLAPGQREVVSLFGKGYRYDEIAQRLSVPTDSVRNQMQNALTKLQRRYSTTILGEPTGRVPPEAQLRETTRRPTGEAPPQPHDWSGAGIVWLTLVAVVALVAVVLAVASPTGRLLLRFDTVVGRSIRSFGGKTASDAANVLKLLGGVWLLRSVRWGAFLALIALRRWRHLLVYFGSVLVVGWLSLVVALAVRHASPTAGGGKAGLGGFSHPSRPVAGFAVTMVGVAYALVPHGRWRRIELAVTGLGLSLLGIARIHQGLDYPTQVAVGIVLGVAVPLVAFRLFAPEAIFPVTYRHGRAAHLDLGGRRDQAIKVALGQQLGIGAAAIEPFGLAGSGGSTPLRVNLAGQPDRWLFGKLYAVNHLRADRWYKLGRMILYGSLEDERPFNSVRRLVEYEDYMLRYMRDAGVPTAAPIGFVEITPEREYLILTEYLDGAHEISEEHLTDELIEDALRAVRSLWAAGIAHRDIKPANVLVQGARIVLIDVAFCQARPSPWRQAVDLANMMLVLALGTDAQRVYTAATSLFTPQEVAEAFAATRGVTMPTQLRSQLDRDGRDLIGDFRALAPEREPIPIQRWSVRRIALSLTAIATGSVAILLVVTNIRRTGLL